jgi:16S rRNA U516 pseudouridylate synthase RsuA-like enzyme
MTRRLTKYQARQVKSLVEDSGYSRKEARELVLEGWLSVDVDSAKDRALAEGESRAQALEDRDRDDTFVPDCEAAE